MNCGHLDKELDHSIFMGRLLGGIVSRVDLESKKEGNGEVQRSMFLAEAPKCAKNLKGERGLRKPHLQTTSPAQLQKVCPTGLLGGGEETDHTVT
jgi:hypothetical protein